MLNVLVLFNLYGNLLSMFNIMESLICEEDLLCDVFVFDEDDVMLLCGGVIVYLFVMIGCVLILE